MEKKNYININDKKPEKRDSHLKITNHDLDNLRKFLDRNYNERIVNDCDKYYRK